MRIIWGVGSIIAATVALRLAWQPGFLGLSHGIWVAIAIAIVISVAMGAVGVRRGAASAILSILGLLMSALVLLAVYVDTPGPYRGP